MAHDHLSKQYDQDLEALRSQVLQMGSVPLNILEREIDNWIAKTSKA